MTSTPRQSKNERRAAAREQARLLQQQRQRRERLTKGLTIGGIIVGAVAIIAIAALVIVNAIRPPGPGPENMASGGIVINSDFTATKTPSIAADAQNVPTEEREDISQIIMYLDYQCPGCGAFEAANGAAIEEIVASGAATIEYHPISFLDNQSLGARYSSRAANASGCVAETSPDAFFAWNALMFENQPAEATTGLTDDEIIDIAVQAGVEESAAFTECVRSGQFDSWVEKNTTNALYEPGFEDYEDGVQIGGTPSVFVNGELYPGTPGDSAAFIAFFTSQAGQLTGEAPAESTEATPAPSEG